MAGVYETWTSSRRFSWMKGKGKGIWGVFGKVLGDNSIADMKAALLERFPQFASASANGLNANDRTIERGPSESDEGFAARLIAAPVQWKLGGSPLGLLVQLYFHDFAGAVIVTQNGLAHSLSSAPDLDSLTAAINARTAPSWYVKSLLGFNNPFIPASTDGKSSIPAGTVPWWVFDSGMDAEGNQWCSRFAIIFPHTAPDPHLGVAANLERLRRIVANWKDAKALCVYFEVATGPIWDWPPEVWDDPGLAWDNGTVTLYAP